MPPTLDSIYSSSSTRCALTLLGIAGSFFSNLNAQPLFAKEAVQIITEEVAASEARRQIPDFAVIETHSSIQGNKGIVFRKVHPPILRSQTPVRRKAPGKEDILLDEEILEKGHQHKVLSLGIQVFDGKVSELVWSEAGRTILIYSNIDFSY